MAVGVPLRVGKALQDGGRPLLPLALGLVLLGLTALPLLLLVLHLLRLARQRLKGGLLIAGDGPEVLHLEAPSPSPS